MGFLMANMSAKYLDLLASVGVHIDADEWNQVHWNAAAEEPIPWEAPVLPTAGLYTDDHGIPTFSRSQIDLCDPTMFGFHEYDVVEDAWSAHPLVPSYEQELDWKRNHRPIHRYDRSYRIRWTLAHIVGLAGTVPPALLEGLSKCIRTEDLMSRRIYECVRHWLKRGRHSRFYMAIPLIIRQLGGPCWRISTEQYRIVLHEAVVLHRLFDAFKQQSRGNAGCRKRFPKIHFVLLRLLDRHGVWAPYKMVWARTLIKTHQLRRFLGMIERQRTCTTNENTTQTQTITKDASNDDNVSTVASSRHSSTTIAACKLATTNVLDTPTSWNPGSCTTITTTRADSSNHGLVVTPGNTNGPDASTRSACVSISKSSTSTKTVSATKIRRQTFHRSATPWHDAAARFARTTVGTFGSSRHRILHAWIHNTDTSSRVKCA